MCIVEIHDMVISIGLSTSCSEFVKKLLKKSKVFFSNERCSEVAPNNIILKKNILLLFFFIWSGAEICKLYACKISKLLFYNFC